MALNEKGTCEIHNDCKLWQNNCTDFIALHGREMVTNDRCGNCRHWTQTEAGHCNGCSHDNTDGSCAKLSKKVTTTKTHTCNNCQEKAVNHFNCDYRPIPPYDIHRVNTCPDWKEKGETFHSRLDDLKANTSSETRDDLLEWIARLQTQQDSQRNAYAKLVEVKAKLNDNIICLKITNGRKAKEIFNLKNDLDEITHLWEHAKEARDLNQRKYEIAAKEGKELLNTNESLERRNANQSERLGLIQKAMKAI